MKSQWYEYKDNARELRQQGLSIGHIESRLGIPRSTLSGWFKDIKLTKKQKDRLLENKSKALAKARRKAIAWHNAAKNKRLNDAEIQASRVVNRIDITDKNTLELALAILYLGEGTKRKIETSMGSSDPMILKFFITAIRTIYELDISKIKCQLNLRADQNPMKMKRFWSQELGVPIDNFGYVSVDKRTIGSKTYPSYKGVCQVLCGNSAIQRRLMSIYDIFCKKTIEKHGDG